MEYVYQSRMNTLVKIDTQHMWYKILEWPSMNLLTCKPTCGKCMRLNTLVIDTSDFTESERNNKLN